MYVFYRLKFLSCHNIKPNNPPKKPYLASPEHGQLPFLLIAPFGHIVIFNDHDGIIRIARVGTRLIPSDHEVFLFEYGRRTRLFRGGAGSGVVGGGSHGLRCWAFWGADNGAVLENLCMFIIIVLLLLV